MQEIKRVCPDCQYFIILFAADIYSIQHQETNGGTPAPQMPIPLLEPDANFTTLDDSMINTAAANVDMQCDLSTKSLHDLLESAINDTFGAGTLGS